MTERHPNSARFHDLLAEAGELHDLKQSDYGRGDDPFSNVRASEEWGIDGWKGAMIRLNDKVRRLQSLARNGSLNNEAAIDSFMDIAVYSLIARVLFEQEEAEDPIATDADFKAAFPDRKFIGASNLPRSRAAKTPAPFEHGDRDNYWAGKYDSIPEGPWTDEV